MPVQMINKLNIPNNTAFQKNNAKNISDGSFLKDETEPKAPTNVKLGAFISTLAGISVPLAFILKKQGFSIKNLKLASPKSWGIFKADYKKEGIEKLVIKLGIGSVLGGLAGGAIIDKKENMKAKYRESIIQIIGNIATPLACVSLGMRGFKKVEPSIEKTMIGVANSLKAGKVVTNLFKNLPNVLASAICLGTGIILGNKIGNLINKELFKIDDKRKLQLSDMSPHVDDLCLATSLVAAQSSIGTHISKIIPAALMVAGCTVGTAQEKPAIIAKNQLAEVRKQEPSLK